MGGANLRMGVALFESLVEILKERERESKSRKRWIFLSIVYEFVSFAATA